MAERGYEVTGLDISDEAITHARTAAATAGLKVELAAAESVLPGYQDGSDTMVAGDITVVATREYDVAGSRLLSNYRFSRGDEVVDVTAVHHVLTNAQIRQLLTAAGFVDIELFAGPDGSPYSLGRAGCY